MPKVLLIDDSKTIQKVASLILKSGPYQLLTASTSDEGEKVAMREKPDVALVDMTLAPLNGLDLIERFSNHAELKHMRTALMYGHYKVVDEKLLQKAGAGGKLAKPFDSQEFLKVLEDLINGRTVNQPIHDMEKQDQVVPMPADEFKRIFDEEEIEASLNFLEKPLALSAMIQAKDASVTVKPVSAETKTTEQISRELIEKVCWEVIPPLAEKIIREEIQKLLKDSN